MKSFVYVTIVVFISGCAAARPQQERPPEVLPAPSSFDASGTGEKNLPPKIAVEWGVPASFKVSVHADGRSEATSVSPARSHHEAHLTLLATDDSGKQSFINISLNVNGDSEGTPTHGLEQAAIQLFNAFDLITRAATQPSPLIH